MQDKYILTIGGHAIDYFYDVESFPQAGDFAHAEYRQMQVGGCVPNCGSVAAALGSEVYHLDTLKKNDEGTAAILKTLKEKNIHIDYVFEKEDAVNCSCLIMSHESEKTIYVISGKAPVFEVNDEIQNLLNNAQYIYTMMNIVNADFRDLSALKKARNHGAKILFDGGSQYQDSYEKEMLYELADGVFLNRQSYERLKTVTGEEPKEVFLKNGGSFLCVTDGSKGADCYSKDGDFHEDALKIEVVDSTGAGDSFAGAFIASLVKGYSYEKALKIASVNGAYACTIKGGMNGGTDEETLRHFANKYNKDF